MNKNRKIAVAALIFLIIFGVVFGSLGLIDIGEPPEPETTAPVTVTESTTAEPEPAQDVVISDEVLELASDTVEAVDAGEDIASDEIIEAKEADEESLESEAALEPDAVIEQENISYDGTNTGKGSELLGECQGLTYYSQADSRWGYILYTAYNDKSQTIKSSGCGPTSAAMVVSSSKGAILPSTMAKLFVDNGYRTRNNGTAWAAWAFVADYFNFSEYHSTSSFSTMQKYLTTDNNKDGVADYFVVCSAGSGLFTSGGHYIVLVADKDSTITVYDPYLYYGKFNTASRKAAGVTVSGNAAYVSESSFKKYGAIKNYWIFSNDNKTAKETQPTKPPDTGTTVKTYTAYVNTKSSNLNVRKGPGTGYKIVDSLKKGTKVTVYEDKGGWSRIGSGRWVSSAYLSTSKPKSTATVYKTTVGKSYKLNGPTTLYSKSNLSGTRYSYKGNTTVIVLEHASASVDKIKCPATGRVAYVSVDKLK